MTDNDTDTDTDTDKDTDTDTDTDTDSVDYSLFRLPTNVLPIEYDLSLTPSFKPPFIITGDVSITINVIFCKSE